MLPARREASLFDGRGVGGKGLQLGFRMAQQLTMSLVPGHIFRNLPHYYISRSEGGLGERLGCGVIALQIVRASRTLLSQAERSQQARPSCFSLIGKEAADGRVFPQESRLEKKSSRNYLRFRARVGPGND
jgi:hypothetical protein